MNKQKQGLLIVAFSHSIIYSWLTWLIRMTLGVYDDLGKGRFRNGLKYFLIAAFFLIIGFNVKQVLDMQTMITLEEDLTSLPVPSVTICPLMLDPGAYPIFRHGRDQSLGQFMEQVESMKTDILEATLFYSNTEHYYMDSAKT